MHVLLVFCAPSFVRSLALLTYSCATALLLLQAPSVFAADAVMSPDAGSFAEKFDPNVDVSGQAQVGFMLTNVIDHSKRKALQNKVDLTSLQAHFQSTSAKKGEVICYRLASRDGIYSARWTITLTDDIAVDASKTNVFQVRIKSVNEDKIAHYTTRELVAIATVGSSCKDDDRRYISSSWGDVQVKDDTTTQTLYLNSDATQVTLHARFSELDNDANIIPLKSDCIVIPSSEKTIAFDTECPFDIPVTHVVKKLAVSAVNHSTVLPVIRMPVWQP